MTLPERRKHTRSYLTTWQTLTIFAIVVTSFAILLNYAQRNNAEARLAISRLVYDNCDNRRVNTVRLNAQNAALVKAVSANRSLDGVELDQLNRIYGVVLDVPDCGSRP